MARPRIFVSSTYYDLKHIRSSLDNFIESLGYDSVLSEKGDIAYSPDIPLDESCYREASGADIFVLIIGGRYGSSASNEEKKPSRTFFDRYDSITKKEYDAAWSKDIPIYILIEQNVYSEYHTYLRNKNTKNIQYAHVDSINIFQVIEEILSRPRNNPVRTFERFPEIEAWLKEQWAGLFRELLQRVSNQKQISNLSSQVETLGAINSTLQRYLEVVISKVSPDDASELIKSEHARLSEIEQLEQLKRNSYYRKAYPFEIEVEHFKQALSDAKTYSEFLKILAKLAKNPNIEEFGQDYENNLEAIIDINDARYILGKMPFPLPSNDNEPSIIPRSSKKARRSD
jgi:Domain of unknown function (DUF4062)